MPPPEELASMGSLEGLDDDLLELLRSRAVSQPFGTYTQPWRLENPARAWLSRVGILCGFSICQVQGLIAGDDPVFLKLVGPTLRFVGPPTGQRPMFSRPEDPAELPVDLPSQ